MSCGTHRINRFRPPNSREEKLENAARALNTPSIYDTITREELEEVNDYAHLPDDEGRV